MSPLLGALGDSSEYAYRGNLDDIPINFDFTDIFGAEPGIAYTTGPILIDGINNKIRVAVSTGASIAVNSGIFTSGPTVIREGDVISLYTPTTQGTDTDFNKTYIITATFGGRTTKDWVVRTRTKDSVPTPFAFTSVSNQELGVINTSNTITVSGLEPTVSSIATIVSGIGSFRKNGGAPGTASTVGNGDTIAIVLQAPTDYSSTNTTEIGVGEFTTPYSVSTRSADTTVNQFTFTNFTNVAISSSFDSNSITLSGADINTAAAPVPLTATVTNGFLKVERASSVVRDFSANPATVFNGDVLTLKINSSPFYSTIATARLTVTGVNDPVGVASTFSVTTRPNISDTIVDQFQIVDKNLQGRNIATISDPITISGITTGADDFANIFLTNNADGGQFRIKRGGQVVRDFASTPDGVRNGDVVDFKITTSPASGGVVITNVNIAGTDNNDINNVFSQTRTDTWIVQSAVRNCPLSLPTFTPVERVEPGTLQSVTFTPTGYDSDCRTIVSTSNPNSYITLVGESNVGVVTTAATITLTSSTVSSGNVAPNSIFSLTSGVSGALNRNPQLSWSVSGLPSGVTVENYAIQLEDLCSTPKFVHWNLTGIAATVTSIPLGATTLPFGATIGLTSWPSQTFPIVNSVGYGGPAPPAGRRRYRVTIRATLSRSSSVLVRGIEFLAGTGAIVAIAGTATYSDQPNVVTTGIGNNLLVLPGVGCTVYLPAGTFGEKRTTAITLTANDNVPAPVSVASTWSVTTRPSTDPTINLTAIPKTIDCNDPDGVLLNWKSTKTVSVRSTGFDAAGIGTGGDEDGDEIIVFPKTTTTYSITATGPDGTTKTDTETVVVRSTAAVTTFDATEILVPFNGSSILSWSTENASSIVSNFGDTRAAGVFPLSNLRATTTYTISAVSNDGCANSLPRSVTINVLPCTDSTSSDDQYGNFEINYISANAGDGFFRFYYSSLSGFGADSPARDSGTTDAPPFTDFGRGTGFAPGTCGRFPSAQGTIDNCQNNTLISPLLSWTVPAGVTEITIDIQGAGGGGAGGGPQYPGGFGGDGGSTSRVWPVSPGDRILYSLGPGGQGSQPCGPGNIDDSNQGRSAGPGYSTFVYYNNQSILICYAIGGGGGGRGSLSGSVDGTTGDAQGEPGAFTFGGGAPGGSGGPQSANPCTFSPGLVGRTGGPGTISISYSTTSTSDTWTNLIEGIVQQFKTSFNRPPTNTEMNTYIRQYTGSTTLTVANIRSNIAAANLFRSTTGAVTICGNTL